LCLTVPNKLILNTTVWKTVTLKKNSSLATSGVKNAWTRKNAPLHKLSSADASYCRHRIPRLCENWLFSIAFAEALQVATALSQTNAVRSFLQYRFKVHYSITLTSTPKLSKWSPRFSFPCQNSPYTYHNLGASYTLHPSFSSLLWSYNNNNTQSLHFMKGKQ